MKINYEKLFIAVLGGLLVVLGLLFLPLLYGTIGAITGYGFGLFFPGTAYALNTLLGTQYAYQSGALLGFVSAWLVNRSR